MYRILKSNRLIGLHTRNFLKSKHEFRNNQWRTNCHNTHWNYIAFSQRCDLNTYYAGITLPSYSLASQRNFSSTPLLFDKEPLKSSSKVEDTVNTLKKGLEGEEKGQEQTEVVVKKSLKQRIKEELIHYYHGFRLLGLEIRISSSLVLRIIKGESLSRREHRLLVRTIGDLFRLIPFLVFIVVPFLEFALPIVLKFFPGMLPSTFETRSQTEQKYRKHLKVKLEMAKFFQETLDEMAPQAKDRHSKLAKEFQDFFVRVRQSGEMATSEEIMKFATLFEDEVTLDSLQRQHLVALCRVLNVTTLGTSAMLRFNLRMKLRSLAADDKMISKEGVDSLNLAELQQACKARGMRAYGVSEERLRNELKNWLVLSLNEKVPPSLLLLSRALMVPDNVPTAFKLKATITALPEQVITQTKAAIGEKEGKLDFKTKAEAIKLEEAKIKEEKKEREENEKENELINLKNREKEELIDKATVMDAASTPELRDPAPIIADEKPTTKKEEVLSAKDMEVIEDAIENIAQSKKSLVLEKEGIHELKQEMSDYTEDVKELQEIIRTNKAEIKVSKGAKRLYRAVNSMISKMDKVLYDLESKEKALKSSLEQTKEEPKETKEKLIHIDELMSSIKNLQKVPDDAKLKLIQDILGRLDDDFDGQLKVDDVLKMVEIIGNEHVHLSGKQMSELIELMDKEEILEVESKIQKALDQAAKQNIENVATQKSLFDMIKEAQERKAMKVAGTESREQQSLPADEMVPKSTSETKSDQRPRNP